MRTLLKALISHWRQKPFQLLTLVIGLAVATALWSGVQALNAEARASYDQAASVLGGDGLTRLGAEGRDVALEDYVMLRLSGWKVSPVIEGRLRGPRGSLRIIGIDPITLPVEADMLRLPAGSEDIGAFLSPEGRVFLHPTTVDRLPETFPQHRIDDSLPPGVAIMDISLAERLLEADAVSYLIFAPDQRQDLTPVEVLTDGRVGKLAQETQGDLARLTDSFHLNLTAFGFLSFVVGLFIVHSTIGLAFEQRRAMFRTLRACGTSSRMLVAGLVMELSLIVSISAVAGMVMGYVIAATLLPDVALSLRGLYGAEISGELSLRPSWWALGLGMSFAGALVASVQSLWRAANLPVLAPALPEAWHAAQQASLRRQSALASGLLIGAGLLLIFGSGLAASFAVMGGVLMGAALMLPVVLNKVLSLAASRARAPLARWFWADGRQQLRGLSLALMALLLALSVNIGVGTMVDSFRKTFLGWLDQRLAAELYVTASDDAQGADIARWLTADERVDAILPIWGEDLAYQGWPFTLYGVVDHPTYADNWPILEGLTTPWEKIAGGDHILVSEQLARRFELTTGDTLSLPVPNGAVPLIVAGVYPDYGNPVGAAIVSQARLLRHFPDVAKQRFGLRMAPEDVAGLQAELTQQFALSDSQTIDQAGIKGFSRQVFEKTFAVTIALNALTLTVAGIALLTSLLTLATMRLPQLAPLWAMGITRATLGRIELIRALMLAFLTAILALPLGLAVAWILMQVINVEAFGWKLPIFLFPGQWIALLAMALGTAALAALWPVIKLRRTPAGRLLRIFADER